MKAVRVLTRLLVGVTLVVLSLDGLLLAAAFYPDAFAWLVPLRHVTDGDPSDLLDLWPVAGWLIGFSLLVWAVSRDGHYVTPDRVQSDYARAIPPHPDGVDLRAGKPGAGAWEMAAALRAGPHASPEERDKAEQAAANWEAGAKAEEKAARLLKALGPDWTVLHDITVHHRGWNIDHVAIGPQGVFVINTKTTRASSVVAEGDRLTVGGRRTDYIAKSRTEGFRTQVALFGRAHPVSVTPVLLFVDTTSIEFRSPPGDVWITEGYNVVTALTGGPIRLSPKQYGRLVAKARYQQTWIDGWDRAHHLSRAQSSRHG